MSAPTALLVAGLTVMILAIADRGSVAMMLPGALGRLTPALLVNAAAAAVAWLERAITTSGAMTGAALGTVIYVGAGWEGWTMLVATFTCAVITSNVGIERKRALGLAEPNEGRRGARHAIANCAVAAGCAVAAISSPFQSQAWLALVAALAAAGADTAASEIGKARGGTTVLITTGRAVTPGANGGVSVAGSLVNVAVAALLSVLGAAVGLIAASDVPLATLAALAGCVADSIVGATLEQRGVVDNETTNFINTAVAAAVAVYLSS